MDYMSFEDDEFNAWYSQLYKQERQQFHKEIRQIVNRAIEKYFTSLPTIKDIDIGEPCVFTNLLNSKYTDKEE